MSCGVGHRHGSDPMLLWCRPAAAAPIRPLALELPCATGVSIISKNTKQSSKIKLKSVSPPTLFFRKLFWATSGFLINLQLCIQFLWKALVSSRWCVAWLKKQERCAWVAWLKDQHGKCRMGLEPAKSLPIFSLCLPDMAPTRVMGLELGWGMWHM